MREIGIVTLLSVAVTAAAPGPQAYRPSVYVTPKSTQDFASCFARVEDRRGARLVVRSAQITGEPSPTLAARMARATYFIAIDDRGGRREIALDQRAADAAPRKALNQCI